MKNNNKQKKISITEEYFSYHEKYTSKYGLNTIILLEVGSFYEMYSNPLNNKGPDLYKISEILNIIVTRKDKTLPLSDSNVLMSGMPNHAISKFLKLLIDNNFIVVIFKQHKTIDGIYRSLEGIYSPSTFIDNITIENKYLMILYIEINFALNSSKPNISIGMSAIDISTGNVFWYESHGSGIINENESWEEAQRFYHFFRPIELIIYQINNTTNQEKININEKIDILPNQIMLIYNKINPEYIKLSYQTKLLKKVYQQYTIESPIEYFNLDKYIYARIALINSFDYIFQHNENFIKELKIPQYFNEYKYMILGNNAQYQLNIVDYYNWDKIESKFYSLNAVVNNCLTPMGKRMLKQRLCAPFTDIKTIESYYNLTELILKLQLWENVRLYLKEICDFDKLFRKLSIKYIQPYELYLIYKSMENIIKIIKLLSESEFKIELYKIFTKNQIKQFVDSINQIENKFNIELLKQTNLIDIKNSFYLKGIYPDIDNILDQIENSIGLVDKLSKVLEETCNDVSLSVKRNDRDGYYINTTKIRGEKLESELKKLKKNFKLGNKNVNYNELIFKYQSSSCKISYPGLSDHSDEIDVLYSNLDTKIKEYFYQDTMNWYDKNKSIFKDLINMIVQLDFITNNAFTSVKYHYVKPTINSSIDSYIHSQNLRHPIIERLIDFEYVPHDVKLDNEIKGNLIYGFNSCGKSSYMKSVGLNLIMAQCGLYVAADSFEYSIYDSIYTRISGNDNLFKGQSSFIIEMNELRTILKKATSKSLIIGDEICRGTEYLSANSIVSATIIKLVEMGANFLFATHLHELKDIDEINSLGVIKFFYLSVEKHADELIFSRKLLEGTGEQIYGITVAQYILNDPAFINTVINIKNNLLEKAGKNTKLLSVKKSNYNKEIYMDKCVICGNNNNLESHHINWQKDFILNINGHINNKKKHIVKDSIANLIVLCSKCHDGLHNKEFTINQLVKTTSGVKAI